MVISKTILDTVLGKGGPDALATHWALSSFRKEYPSYPDKEMPFSEILRRTNLSKDQINAALAVLGLMGAITYNVQGEAITYQLKTQNGHEIGLGYKAK